MEMIIYTESYSVIAQEGQEPEQRPELHCGSREKRNRMKKIFVYIIMSSLIAGMLSGCGGEYRMASKGVSGSAVSGAVVETRQTVSHYIYVNPQESGKTVKYDIQSRKEVPVEELQISSRTPEILFMDCGNQAAALCAEIGLFVQNVEETGWKLVSDNKDLAWSWMAWDAAALFYTTTDTDRDFVENVWKINLKTRSEERFVSKEQLWRVAAAALGIEESGMELCAVTRLFCDGGRCYVQVQVNWPEEEIYHMEYLMFSQGEEETELRFEKALTECMRTYGTTREGKWMNYDKQNKVIVKKWVTKEHVLLRDAKCYCIKNGKAFLCLYDYEKGRERVGYYELESGEFHWLYPKDAEYYEPCYDEPQGDRAPLLSDYYGAGYRFRGIDWSPNVDAPVEGPEGGFEEE